ncbi:hypothetical protein G7046_g10123 [Stylonectria norvegica]|nr:hypothetical protein G7046_g10123 [Stylonectria norvegica]
MMPISPRQLRLLRSITLPQRYPRASIPPRRFFRTSIARRCVSPQLNTDATAKQAADNSSSVEENARSLNSSPDVAPARNSRLAALKGRGKAAEASGDGDNAPRYVLGHRTDRPIRARFAPSPTGYLHLGSLRTALMNNLVARATEGGKFIIRIEDTDQSRLVEDAEKRIYEDLRWAGLEWDEGPDIGGPYAPYRQASLNSPRSDRLPIYKEHIHTLLDNSSAYRCFCSSEQLLAQSKTAHEAGHSTVYPGTCRTIPRDESKRRAAFGEPHVIRFDAGLFGNPPFKDAIYGPFKKKDVDLEDFILVKSDGYPTYHLANVIDDHLMKITHEWLISTPKHTALYQAFGWEPPTFAHLGLLVNKDGTKLSKRQNSASLTTYREQHIFSVAMQSWLANLGSSFNAKAKMPLSLQGV